MKKIIKRIMISTVFCIPFVFFSSTIFAQSDSIPTISVSPTKVTLPNGGTVEVLGYEGTSKKIIRLYENNTETIIKYDYDNHYFEVNGVKHYEKTNKLRSSIDYRSGVTYTGKIPWKGSLSATASIIGFIFSKSLGVAIANAIVNFITSEYSDYYYSYTRYRSQEDYWSDYTGSYYKQECWRNIKIYKDYIAPHNLVAGPFNGTWFDPVRPF